MTPETLEKSCFGSLSEFFFSNTHLLSRSLGLFSYGDASVQAFVAANLCSFFLEKGFRVSLADLMDDFPNARMLWDGPIREGFNIKCKGPRPELAEDFGSLEDVCRVMSRKSLYQETSFEKSDLVFVNMPFNAKDSFVRLLRMFGFLVILSGEDMGSMMKTSYVLRWLSEKKTDFVAGVLFTRSGKRSEAPLLFERLQDSLCQDVREQVIFLGSLPVEKSIFQSLLAGSILLYSDKDAPASRLIARAGDCLYRAISCKKREAGENSSSAPEAKPALFR